MEIRKLTTEDKEASLNLGEFAFQHELTDEEREERLQKMRPEWELGAFTSNNELASKVLVLPVDTYYHGRKLSTGAVSGVATWPEFRRHGLVKKLLMQSIEEMYQKQMIVSMLHPFAISFYRKFGWELFCDKELWRMDAEDLPKPSQPADGYVTRLKSDQYEPVKAVYEGFAANYDGTISRPDWWWERRMSRFKSGQRVVYFNKDNEPEGYILYQVKDQKLSLHQMAYLNNKAKRALWAFISQHDSMIDEAELNMPTGEFSRFMMRNPGFDIEKKSYAMARIIDVEAFLKSTPFHAVTEPIELNIKDPLAPWNEGSYQIDTHAGTVEKTSDFQKNDKILTLDINTLVPLFYGYSTPIELYQHDFIKGPASQIEQLQKSIPTAKPFIYDFF
ncbi:GNAT family N-acetyltransferase [Salsuginibacillus kocurii]|uniref:GNAT family N-acetyltransferase n=1 Tax=Salsuginibacillus kocurii TaxID=427078 RepID=UPI000378A4F0|nr:GNAT family N-acetyltransferase [Salsuginibacillus kocurii]